MSITPEVIAEIRARHEEEENTTGHYFDSAHADRATLLRLLAEAQERAERAEAALKPFAEAQFHLLEATRRRNGTPMMLVHMEVPYATSIYAASGWFARAAQTLKERKDG